MSNISVKFNIKSASNNYLYNGSASLNRDIISFKDKEDEYYIDLSLKRIARTSKKNYMMIDFNKAFIEYKLNDLNTKIDMNIISYDIEDNVLKIKYKLEEEINVLLEWSSYE